MLYLLKWGYSLAHRRKLARISRNIIVAGTKLKMHFVSSTSVIPMNKEIGSPSEFF